MPKVAFEYFGFWDVPRWIACNANGFQFYLASEFDEALDEYSPAYEVHLLPPNCRSIGPLWEQATEANRIGSIPVESIEFDESKRKLIEIDPMLKLLDLKRSEAS